MLFYLFNTKRVLTAEFCNGCKINNVEEIKRQGLSLKDVSRNSPINAKRVVYHRFLLLLHQFFVFQTADKLIRTFAEQIFYTGFIHADPHPGNGGQIMHVNARVDFIICYFMCIFWFQIQSILLLNPNDYFYISSKEAVQTILFKTCLCFCSVGETGS